MNNSAHLNMLLTAWKHQKTIHIDDDQTFISELFYGARNQALNKITISQYGNRTVALSLVDRVVNGILLTDITNKRVSFDVKDKVFDKLADITVNSEAYTKNVLTRELKKKIRESFNYSFYVDHLPYCIGWSISTVMYLTDLIIEIMDATFPLKYFKVSNEMIDLFVLVLCDFLEQQQEYILSHDLGDKLNEEESVELLNKICRPLLQSFTI